MAQYDVIIIGAGHNGLVAAAYLAQAGRRVLVLEKRDTVGGAAVSEEIFPGFKISTVADGCGYLSAKVRRDLKVDAHVETVPSDVVAFCPQPDGTQLTIWRDTQRTVEEIAGFSKADAEEYPKFVELMSRIADVVGGLMEMTPPDLPEVSLRDLLSGAALLGPVRRLGRKRIPDLLRILPMPAADLLNEFFEADAVRAAIGASSVLNINWGPQEAGTAYTLLNSWAQSGTGLFRSAGVVKGGMGALTGALADVARGFGAEIRTGASVAEVIVKDERATGVRLSSGEEHTAAAVVSNADPRTTFHELLEPQSFDAQFMRHVRNIKYRGSAARIHLALRALPQFTSLVGGDATTRLSGPIQMRRRSTTSRRPSIAPSTESSRGIPIWIYSSPRSAIRASHHRGSTSSRSRPSMRRTRWMRAIGTHTSRPSQTSSSTRWQSTHLTSGMSLQTSTCSHPPIWRAAMDCRRATRITAR